MDGVYLEEGLALLRSCDVIDLHIDTHIPMRLWGYDPLVRHDPWWLGRRFFTQFDIPRAREGGLTGLMWSITTNPLRTSLGRWEAFCSNWQVVKQWADASDGRVRFVRNRQEYNLARQAGAMALMLSIQGGHSLDAAPDGLASLEPGWLIRVTLVHLTNSSVGATSSPLARMNNEFGLTRRGRELVEQLDAARVLVDLAHIHPTGFWDAVAVHDRTLPLVVTHTGISSIHPHWRNIDDDQVRAIARTGGTIGIMFHAAFLGAAASNGAEQVLRHAERVVELVGEDHVSIGSDLDGFIIPYPDLAASDHYPALVAMMLARGWKEPRIRKTLGLNALRVLETLRP